MAQRDRCIDIWGCRRMRLAGVGVGFAFPPAIQIRGLDGSIIGTAKPYETNDPRKQIINNYLIEYSGKLLTKFGDELNNQNSAESTATAMVDAMLAARIPIMAEKFCESVNTDYEHIPTEEFMSRPDIEVLFEIYVKLTEKLSDGNTPEKEKTALKRFKTQFLYKLDKAIHNYLEIAYSADVLQEAQRTLEKSIQKEKANN